MPATNEILAFASTNTGTNLLTQAEYSADAQRTNGNQPGTARSKLVNKVLRQTSLVSAGLSQFLADLQAAAVTDGLTPAEYSGLIEDAMSAFFDAKLAAAQVVKPGAMMMWPKSTPPTGWLKRNGAAISRTTYAPLFAVLGTDFGVGDGSTTFNLPDDRALFERGWDDGLGVDTGRAFGSTQTDDIKLHGHPYRTSTGNGSNDPEGALCMDNNGTHVSQPAYTGTVSSTSTQLIGGTGGSETRPRNRAYLPIIKY